MNGVLRYMGKRLAHFLSTPRPMESFAAAPTQEELMCSLQVGDVLLVEGNTRFSVAIKYLTQSTWSHAAIYVGEHLAAAGAPENHCLIDSDTVHGVRSFGLKQFENLHVRICRPIGLGEPERVKLAQFVIEKIGAQYDMRHVFDLVRYLLPTPPVPTRFRRKMLSLGSGDPTRAICSSLIAQAFESIHYPILPLVEKHKIGKGRVKELLHVRHYSLFTPRDFDVSPYFQIIKPELPESFNYRNLYWVMENVEVTYHPETDEATLLPIEEEGKTGD